ncbi:NAD(P)H-dependent oxidoreductase [Aurantimonas sp. Leaf443]|uniref:NADPH-dependent FMN reductase n=1 Tax=Aurantimonas sp. Leaf443 TaxID=1736378 RepID=UPI0006FE62CF|nr:NAD(P)H-dependent oxidoreductase [Aurantimonas sp. Leaf443]KQT83403.1 NADPH-dependent FMN reductase [Aurantimonas sp. Leaf443]
MPTVAVFVGSLRRESLNRRFAESIAALAGDRLRFDIVDLSDVPMYNDDLWAETPAGVTRMKAAIEAADAVLFVTPEYNRSYPAVLKNAIDWASRPYGRSSWAGKPAAVVGTSPGSLGAAVAQNELRNILTVVGLIVMGQPEVYFQFKPEAFEGADVVEPGARTILNHFVDAFAAFVARTAQPRPAEQPDATRS